MSAARKLDIRLLALDFVCLVAVYNAIIRLWGVPSDDSGIIVTALILPAILVIPSIYLIDGYSFGTDMMSLEYTSQHFIAWAAALAVTLLVIFVFIPAGIFLQTSRGAIAASFGVLAPITLLYRRALYHAVITRRGRRSVIFLGDRASCLAFRDECRRMGGEERVVYTVISEDSATPFSDTELSLQPFSEVLQQVQEGRISVEAIVLRESNRELGPAVAQRLVSLYFAGVPTYTLELYHQVHWRKIPLYRLNQTWLFQEGFRIAREPVFERVKRASDIALASLGLVLAAPLMIVAAIAIWLEDRGPILFLQTRIGLNHVPFRVLKLRTMRVRTEAQAGGSYTQQGDPRITRIGRILRATRLDEFPQLWNVLRGEMSMIGPRAEWDRLVAEYEEKIPCYFFRHLVKPGITGWAQVNYPYGASLEDTTRKLEYDLYYIRHFSFTLDASIVLKTIHTMLFGKGR